MFAHTFREGLGKEKDNYYFGRAGWERKLLEKLAEVFLRSMA